MTKLQVGTRISAWVTSLLVVAAVVAVVFGCSLAFRAEDTEPLESPLMLSVARQLVRGPRELYGPFGRLNPLVIIHAPLYYRLAALLAWAFQCAGLHFVTAALAAGRSLSLLGLAWTIAIAYRLARFDGRCPRVGWWAVLLILACPAVGVIPYTVRPDMLGVALQTTGVFLVLSTLRSERPGRIILAAAFAIFGLAFCVKQQLVAAPAISALLVIKAWLRGRVSSNHVAGALLAYAAIVLFVYGTEELVTQGEMSQSVFRAAFAVSRVHPADPVNAALVLYAIVGRSTGLIAMLLAASVASVGTLRGTVRPTIVFVGNVVLVLIALGAVVSALNIILSRWDLVLTLACLTVAAVIVIPASCFLSPRMVEAERIDRLMWIYLTAELGLVAVLSSMSTGAWVNYGIQGVVFASIMIARALGRAFERAQSHKQLLPIAFAAVVVLIGVSGDSVTTFDRRHYEQEAARGLV